MDRLTFDEWIERELFRQTDVGGLDIQASVNPLQIVIEIEEQSLYYFNQNLNGIEQS